MSSKPFSFPPCSTLQFIPWLRQHHGDNQHAAKRNESEEAWADYADRKAPSFVAL